MLTKMIKRTVWKMLEREWLDKEWKERKKELIRALQCRFRAVRVLELRSARVWKL